MKYEQLLEWAKEKGMTEEQILFWYAYADAASVLDMTTKEVAELLLRGVHVTPAHVKEHWESLDEQTQADYMKYMIDNIPFKD
jgi:hypothetical protein